MSDYPPAGAGQAIILIVAPVFAILGAVLLAPLLATIESHYAEVAGVHIFVPLLMTAPALCLALFSPLAGVLGDRVGNKHVLLVSYALYGVAGTAPMYLQSLHAILASRLLVGIAEAGLVTASSALLSALFAGNERQKWFAYQSAVLPVLGSLVVIATARLASWSWRATFGVYGASFIMMLLVASLLREPGFARGRATTAMRRWPPVPVMLNILGIAIPGSIAFYAGPTELAYLLAHRGYGDPGTASIVTAIGLVVGPPMVLLARRLTHLPVGLLEAAAMVSMGSGLILMAIGTSVTAITLGVVVQQGGGALMFSTAIAYFLSLAPPEQRGLYSGAWFFVYMLAQFLTPFATAGLMSLTGDRSTSLVLFGVMVIASCAWLIASRALRRAVVPSPRAGRSIVAS